MLPCLCPLPFHLRPHWAAQQMRECPPTTGLVGCPTATGSGQSPTASGWVPSMAALPQSWHAVASWACRWGPGGCGRSVTLSHPREHASPPACGGAALAACGCGAAGPAKG
eukprot:1161659-Pelagomonas_calceolata.AAC.17